VSGFCTGSRGRGATGSSFGFMSYATTRAARGSGCDGHAGATAPGCGRRSCSCSSPRRCIWSRNRPLGRDPGASTSVTTSA